MDNVDRSPTDGEGFVAGTEKDAAPTVQEPESSKVDHSLTADDLMGDCFSD